MSENKNAVVVFNGARQHSFSAKADCLVTLNAGKNVVSIAKIEKLTKGECKSESFIEMCETGEINILDAEAVLVAETKEPKETVVKKASDDTIEVNIVKLGAREAISLISTETDVDIIQGYLDAEKADTSPRTTVVKACEQAVDALLNESGE